MDEQLRRMNIAFRPDSPLFMRFRLAASFWEQRTPDYKHSMRAQGPNTGKRPVKPRGVAAGKAGEWRRQGNWSPLDAAAREPATDDVGHYRVYIGVGRVAAAHVIDDDAAAWTGDSEQLSGDGGGDIRIGDAAEEGERQRQVEGAIAFRYCGGAAGMPADIGRMRGAVLDRYGVDVDPGHIRRRTAPLHHLAEVVSGRTARFKDAYLVQASNRGATEEAEEESLPLLDHQQVAEFEDGMAVRIRVGQRWRDGLG